MDPTPEVASPAAVLSEATQLLQGVSAGNPWGKVNALQPLVERGDLVSTVYGNGTLITAKPELGSPEHFGKTVLETDGNNPNSPHVYKEFFYDMNGRMTVQAKTAKEDSGGWTVTDRTTYEYHPNGVVSRTERRYRDGKDWKTDIELFDDQGRPLGHRAS